MSESWIVQAARVWEQTRSLAAEQAIPRLADELRRVSERAYRAAEAERETQS